MSLLEAPWWGAFVSGIRRRPVRVFAAELGLTEEELLAALVEADTGGSAEEAPWWPEALRLRETTSIRALASQFGCEPRRIRRALARAGVRVAGEELYGRGVPALRPFRDRLGREPDATLAEEAGVPIEAVQGERRRLGLPPFYPGAPPLLTPEEEAWIRGPEPIRRGRIRQEQEAVEVVRRPARSSDRTGVERPDVPRPAWERRAERPAYERPPQHAGEVAAEPSAEPARTDVPEGHEGRAEAHERRLSPGFFTRGRNNDELERLLQPAARPRDGRQRIVRAPAPRSSPGAAEPAHADAPARTDGLPSGGPILADAPRRVVAPSLPAAPATPTVIARPRRRLAGDVPLRSPVIAEPAPKAAPAAPAVIAAPPTRAEKAAPAVIPAAPARAEKAAPAVIAAAPARAEKAAPAVIAAAPARAEKAAPAVVTPPKATPPAVVAPPKATPPAVATATWSVRLPDGRPALQLVAPDVLAVARMVAARFTPDVAARASIELAGVPVGRPPAPADLTLPAPWATPPVDLAPPWRPTA